MGLLITGDGVVYTDDGLVDKDTPENCVCCDPIDDDLPDWVDPGGPDWPGPGGPGGPTDPDGTPRCCTGNTICSPNDDEKLYIGVRITGTIANDYVYGSGSNAGTPFSYSENFNEVFVAESNETACDIQISPSFNVTVPFRLRNDASNVSRDITISATGVNWNRDRGFFGQQTDSGDVPETNISSGIGLRIGSGSGPIRGTNTSGYDFVSRICRTDSPLLPIVTRPDTFVLFLGGATVLHSGTSAATTPALICLNRVVAEFSDTFTHNPSGGDTNSIFILYRFYAFVSRIAPCTGI
jgi:hypothetical protein